MNEIKMIATRKGFLKVFWERLQRTRAVDPTVSFRKVYEDIETLYEKEYGSDLWPSWDAFRRYLYRHR